MPRTNGEITPQILGLAWLILDGMINPLAFEIVEEGRGDSACKVHRYSLVFLRLSRVLKNVQLSGGIESIRLLLHLRV